MAELFPLNNKVVSSMIPVAFADIQLVAKEHRVSWNEAHEILLRESRDSLPNYALAVQIANKRLDDLLNDNQYDE